jgi:hypothetical protein
MEREKKGGTQTISSQLSNHQLKKLSKGLNLMKQRVFSLLRTP